MALPNSGPLSLSQIQAQFGGTNPISLSEYYGAGGVPVSGPLSVGDFYGKSTDILLTYLIVGGGGGGGGGTAFSNGGRGGKGVVIFSVPTGQAATSTTGSPTITVVGNNTIYTFKNQGGGSITFTI